MRNRLLLMCSVFLALCTTLFVVNVTLAGVSVEPGLEARRQVVDPPADPADAGDGAINESDLEGLFDDEFGEPELPEPLILLPPPPIIPTDLFYVDGPAPLAVGREPSWYSEESDYSSSVAWADVDLDGDMDLAVGNEYSDIGVAIYLSDGGALPAAATWETKAITGVMDLAWGDMDGDGDLDLAVARQETYNSDHPASSVVFRNDGVDPEGGLNMVLSWKSLPGQATSVAWGDVDGDANLDLAIGAGDAYEKDVIRVYLNSGDVLSTTVAWEDSVPDATADVAWGDMDGDGDLDLAAGIDGRNLVFVNQFAETGGFDLQHVWTSDDDLTTSSIAWVDVDQDGHLDLSVGNFIAAPFSDGSLESGTASAAEYGSSALIYRNGETGLSSSPAWETDRIARTTGIDWGDVDADGDLDLLIANDLSTGGYGATEVYQNLGTDPDGNLTLIKSWTSTPLDNSYDAAFADADNDGDLDITVANFDHNLIYENRTGTIGSEAGWQSDEPVAARATRLGDYDRDGDLDLAVALADASGVIVYRNDGADADGRPIYVESWRVEDRQNYGFTWDLAWGDVDGDGDLDLAVANGHTEIANDPGSIDRVYSNDGVDDNGNLLMSACWEASHRDTSSSVAWGDVDGDGDLDLAFGVVEGRSKLYLSQDGRLADEPAWQTDSGLVTSVAWGDVDGDGDLDLAAAVHQGPNRLYLNDQGSLATTPFWQSNDRDGTNTVIWGDVDNDGDSDLVATNSAIPAKLYLNQGGQLTRDASWQSADVGETNGGEWGDVDGDGDLDLIMADGSSSIRIYQNRGDALELRSSWRAGERTNARGLAAGDVNGDGLLDIVTVNSDADTDQAAPIAIHLGRRPAQPGFGVDQTSLSIAPSQSPANFYALSAIQETGEIPFSLSLHNPDHTPLRAVNAAYAAGVPTQNGERWLPAQLTAPISQTALADGGLHPFVWDVYASGFFGRSDNVTVRLVGYPSFVPQPHGVAGPYQRAYLSAETLPMRVRGIQPRVVDEQGNPAENAMVFRVNRQERSRAGAIGAESGDAYLTDANGYLAGHASLGEEDRLIAMAPMTETHAYILYHTSAAPSNMIGVEIKPGLVQTLTVSADHPLYVFNLEASLEWDARNDLVFLANLESAFREVSDKLYDITEGQAAIGEVRVYHAKENWLNSDIVIHASNNQRPRATLGGVVVNTIDDPGGHLPAAYSPGQVRIGPIWDPYGQSREELGEDWRNALTHELGHYLLFLPDNYLGVDEENGILRKIDCAGSIMTDAYEVRYSELLTRDGWDQSAPCRETLAEHLTGRSDWETLSTFFEGMLIPQGGVQNPGPSSLPLEITQVFSMIPEAELDTETDTYPDRFVDLRQGELGPVTRFREAHVYLFKTNAEIGKYLSSMEDDTIVYLGSTGSGDDRIKVRGATTGDRLCIVVPDSYPAGGGCTIVNSRTTSLDVEALSADWPPAIVVSPVSSRTVSISVTSPISMLNVQLLPAYGPYTDTLAVRSPYTTLGAANTQTPPAAVDDSEQSTVYTATLTLPYPAFQGYVRVWQPNAPGHEAFVSYFLSTDYISDSEQFGPNSKGFGPNSKGFGPNSKGFGPNSKGFGPNSKGFGPNSKGFGPNSKGFGPNSKGFGPNSKGFGVNRAWGANTRAFGAPMASGDGKVTIFNVANVLEDSGIASISSVTSLPSLPSWLRAVGPGYRLANSVDVAAADGRTIAFQYLQREVPDGSEHTLKLYHSPDEGETWTRLPTLLDQTSNFAAARLPDTVSQGEGLYALVATIELPALQPGWNLLAYPLAATQTITESLASLAGEYGVIYAQEPNATDVWRLFDPSMDTADPDLRRLVNDLTTLEFGRSYWIYADKSATPMLPVVPSQDAPRAYTLTPGEPVTTIVYAGLAAPPVEPKLPPSTFYGPLVTGSGEGGDIGSVGDALITAQIDGIACGRTNPVQVGDGYAYKIVVAAEAENNGCGWTGAPIRFLLNGTTEIGQATWNNARVQCLPLSLAGEGVTAATNELGCPAVE